jgi:hypothetical protein
VRPQGYPAQEVSKELPKVSSGPAAGAVAAHDPVNHPQHYTSHPSGVECIQVVEHMGFNLGNAIKYIWRADEKGDAVEDLRKAAWYVNREIERRTRDERCPNRYGSTNGVTTRCALYVGHDGDHQFQESSLERFVESVEA